MKAALFCISMVIAALGGQAQDAFFTEANTFFLNYVDNSRVDYAGIKSQPAALESLVDHIGNTDWQALPEDERLAYAINAYNILVIAEILKKYPVTSVQEIAGFFDNKSVVVNGQKMSLNHFEKKIIFVEYPDPRLHFALVCGAVGCPPIIPHAYMPSSLEEQLNKQTKAAMENVNFTRYNKATGALELSKIFEWYTSDFGGKSEVLNFVNKYRTDKIPAGTSYGFYTYDWGINEIPQVKAAKSIEDSSQISVSSKSANRYVVSAAIPKGGYELKVFNNLYTQKTGRNDENQLQNRSTFFNASISALYGLTNRFNAGLLAHVRRIQNVPLLGELEDGTTPPSNALNVFSPNAAGQIRTEFASIGPQIRFAPFPALENFSVQSSFVVRLKDNLENNNGAGWIDWNGPTWNTQFFNDFTLNNNFSLFTEIDFLWQDIGGEETDFNQINTPITVIFSYFPTSKMTLYALTNYSPQVNPLVNYADEGQPEDERLGYWYQAGLGFKYQVTPRLEFELSGTYFKDHNVARANGNAATYNFGIRLSK